MRGGDSSRRSPIHLPLCSAPAAERAGYTIDRELGGGGMSRVFVAQTKSRGRDVVVKVLAPELAQGSSVERAREIRVAARLQHPKIVPLHSAGASGDVPYCSMPDVRDQTLRAHLASGACDVRTSTCILTDIVRALAAGVVHRDIKPEIAKLAQVRRLDASSPGKGQPATRARRDQKLRCMPM